jgi:hypothetical protein
MYAKYAHQDIHSITMYATNAMFKIALLAVVPMSVRHALLDLLYIVEIVFPVQFKTVQHATPQTTVSHVLEATH